MTLQPPDCSRPSASRRGTWERGSGDVVNTGWGLSLRPRDMAAIGQLVLNGGAWEGHAVVPEDWVTESAVPRTQFTNGTGYGYQWWIGRGGSEGATIAWGYGNQYIIVLPTLALVMVSTAENYLGGGVNPYTPGRVRVSSGRGTGPVGEPSVPEPVGHSRRELRTAGPPAFAASSGRSTDQVVGAARNLQTFSALQREPIVRATPDSRYSRRRIPHRNRHLGRKFMSQRKLDWTDSGRRWRATALFMLFAAPPCLRPGSRADGVTRRAGLPGHAVGRPDRRADPLHLSAGERVHRR